MSLVLIVDAGCKKNSTAVVYLPLLPHSSGEAANVGCCLCGWPDLWQLDELLSDGTAATVIMITVTAVPSDSHRLNCYWSWSHCLL